EEMESLRKTVDAGLRGSEARVTVALARGENDAILGEDATAEVTRPIAARVQSALEPKTGWSAAKSAGRAVVPARAASAALTSLLAKLEDIGVFVVPTGAVESFVKEVAHTGPRWVVEVIEKGLVASASEAHELVQRVLSSLPRTVA